jgi:O-methyltransferase
MKQSETITKRTAIYGAGQAGAMALTWLPANHTAVCFIDSAPGKQGTLLGGLPVVSPENALKKELDEILIAVLNREASAQIRENLRQAGFAGEVTEITTFRDHLDVRLSTLRLLKEQIERRGVPGAVAELGVYRGAFAAEINRLFPDRTLYLFDTFAGFDPADVSAEDERTAGDPHAGGRNFSDTGVELVRSVLPHPEKAVFVAGHFPESVAAYAAGAVEQATYALVSLDPDLYRPAADGLRFFWDRLSIGGVILIHDYTSFQYPGIRRAVDEFCDREGLTVIPLPDLHGTAVLLKQE